MPVPKKPASGKMPSTFFHIYVAEGVVIPEYQLHRAVEFFDFAASKFTKLYAEERDVVGRKYLIENLPIIETSGLTEPQVPLRQNRQLERLPKLRHLFPLR